MITYLKRNIRGFYVEFSEPLDPDSFEFGTTYDDFLSQKWVPLSEEQLQFHIDNPKASVVEVLNMQLTPEYVPTEEELVQRAKSRKLVDLDIYDRGSDVNEFTINGVIKAWFTPDERSNYKNSIDSAKLLGVEQLSLLVSGNLLEVPTDKAAQLLAMIQLYADACYMVTEQHKAAINALDSIDDIESYDYTVGYPEKLNFSL